MLLLVIYFGFIGLGLPDAMLGGAWPVMQGGFGARYASAGYVSMIISAGTIVSSALSSRLLGLFGVARVAEASVAMTALALLGIAFAPSFAWLLPAAVPLGLGAGAVDAGLNAFVAERYAARHMSWLHGFWGAGAMSGPLLLSAVLRHGGSWRSAYLIAAAFQACLAAGMLWAHPLWDKVPRRAAAEAVPAAEGTLRGPVALRARGAGMALLAFFCYCGIEASIGLWGASFLSKARGLDPASAARWASFFYAALTGGRFLTGFLSFRMGNRLLIRIGCAAILAGAALLAFPAPFAFAGLLLAGLGCAPVFPCMLHATPERFGPAGSRAMMGYQMAAAYLGTTFLPPAFGFMAAGASLSLLPFFLLAYAAILAMGAGAFRRPAGHEAAQA